MFRNALLYSYSKLCAHILCSQNSERISTEAHGLSVVARNGRVDVQIVDEIAVRYALNRATRALVVLEQLVNPLALPYQTIKTCVVHSDTIRVNNDFRRETMKT